MKYSKEEIETAREQIRKLAPEGTRVYYIIRKVSASGMSRRIDFVTIGELGLPLYLTRDFAIIYGAKLWRDDNGMRVNGCGMNMAEHVADFVADEVYGRESERKEWQLINL